MITFHRNISIIGALLPIDLDGPGQVSDRTRVKVQDGSK
jgi:hypothetical protein